MGPSGGQTTPGDIVTIADLDYHLQNSPFLKSQAERVDNLDRKVGNFEVKMQGGFDMLKNLIKSNDKPGRAEPFGKTSERRTLPTVDAGAEHTEPEPASDDDPDAVSDFLVTDSMRENSGLLMSLRSDLATMTRNRPPSDGIPAKSW